MQSLRNQKTSISHGNFYANNRCRKGGSGFEMRPLYLLSDLVQEEYK